MAPCCSASYYCNEDLGEFTYSDKAFVGSTVLEVLVVINWPGGFGENKTTPLMIWKRIRKKESEATQGGDRGTTPCCQPCLTGVPFRHLSSGQNHIHDFDTEKNSRASQYEKAELEM